MPRTVRHLVIALSTFLLAAVGWLVPTSPARATLTNRLCTAKTEGAYKLDFCVRGWVDASGGHTRGVIEMHTYRYVAGGPNGGWVGSVSKSITLNNASMEGDILGRYIWGNDPGIKWDCRVNGPAGRSACSVPGVERVAFYSKDNLAPGSTSFTATVYAVSFRDAENVPHRFSSNAGTGLLQWGWGA